MNDGRVKMRHNYTKEWQLKKKTINSLHRHSCRNNKLLFNKKVIKWKEIKFEGLIRKFK